MDWDWRATFEQYYSIGITSRPNADPITPVRATLDKAISLMQDVSNPGYQFNLAEVAWLKRYLLDKPTLAPQMVLLENKFFFLGGGITSPDNLVCNGEAFIRNYLTGRNYVKSIGLGNLLTDICWIPDDFGHDPQLPVVLNAMGMKAVSFWRVPGNEPVPPDAYRPTDPKIKSVQDELFGNSVCFMWKAADGSVTLTQQMYNGRNCGYGIIFNQDGTHADTGASTLNSFVQLGFKPASICDQELYVAPCGADFSHPSFDLVRAVDVYNSKYYSSTGIYAVMGTFVEFADRLLEDTHQLRTIQNLDASNFWTGYFATRVQLKINQQRTVNQLMAAESLVTLLNAVSNLSVPVFTALTQQIET